MKLLLVIYFAFCAISDPWVDGYRFESQEHLQIQSIQIVGTSKSNGLIAVNFKNIHYHNHSSGGCGEDCPQHTCHFGHCGLLLIKYFVQSETVINEALFGEYSSYIPDAPYFSFEKPPKNIILA